MHFSLIIEMGLLILPTNQKRVMDWGM